ncbi:hypothetical protein EV356DRAFT_530425 [Viridothelium virens]|uniref:Uncharacterized protein n=1 Tax=Viridothelium virens TaxID=1048519 RepID=A0A6A6HFT6_VIRVR|nr:hypothetical protein EV356DRAFT_530425 [Viridothelium virens]
MTTADGGQYFFSSLVSSKTTALSLRQGETAKPQSKVADKDADGRTSTNGAAAIYQGGRPGTAGRLQNNELRANRGTAAVGEGLGVGSDRCEREDSFPDGREKTNLLVLQQESEVRRCALPVVDVDVDGISSCEGPLRSLVRQHFLLNVTANANAQTPSLETVLVDLVAGSLAA